MSKRLITAAFALSLLCGTSASAQDHHDAGAPHGGGGGGAPHGGGGGAPHPGGGAAHGGGGFPGGGGAPHGAAPAGGFHGAGGGGPFTGAQAPGGHQGHQGNAGGDGGYHGGGYQGGDHGDRGDRGGRGNGAAIAAGVASVAIGAALASHEGHDGGRHYSPQAYPHEVSPGRQYQYRGEWRHPEGYYYRHWGYGERLPRGWFARDYWINNFWIYGLAPAPYGYAWVREGPDALLVNVYTGRVVEVEYGVFY